MVKDGFPINTISDIVSLPSFENVLPDAYYVDGMIFAVASAPEIPMPEQWMPWLIQSSDSHLVDKDVDKLADEDVRHSAQTIFGIIILGGGPVIGGWLSGYLQNIYTVSGVFSFSNLWYTVSAIGLATAIFFFISFRDQLPKEVSV